MSTKSAYHVHKDRVTLKTTVMTTTNFALPEAHFFFTILLF